MSNQINSNSDLDILFSRKETKIFLKIVKKMSKKKGRPVSVMEAIKKLLEDYFSQNDPRGRKKIELEEDTEPLEARDFTIGFTSADEKTDREIKEICSRK